MLTRLLTLALVAASWHAIDACTCSLDHPQTHFCKSDFVIVGRVQKLFKGSDFYDAYKVKIRNVFKATPKAALALKAGRILTPSQDSLCGVALQPRETYIITGRIVHLQAHIHLCGYVSKWREVTPRQRKGFRLLYKQGCTCKGTAGNILFQIWSSPTGEVPRSYKRSQLNNNDLKQFCGSVVHVNRRSTKSPNACVTGYDDCYDRHGICLHDRERRCRWTRAPALTRCLQKEHFNSTMT